ncbi:hypothetical protein L917_14973 [Phytophthora nicotianae]|uniref:SH3 domain-containing protein n=1 Tax=Phytophthora nicotianae TaxID=4792 RepID=W2KJU9_PHYNI|nr:hypothetical protein L917_14973 [Phytophthora nicotianae]
MLPALTTKPKQAVRQVKGLTNDSIDSYSNMPLGGSSSIGGGMTATYVDNTESDSGTPRASPPTTSRATINTGRATVAKPTSGEDGAMARVVRDRKASGEEELSLRTGDIVKVLSTKRTGYLKCEAGDEVGYVPSSYLEFLDAVNEVGNGASNGVSEEAQRTAEKQRKKQKKEKRRKEKREANDGIEPDEAAPVTVRSPRKEAASTDNEGNESPRKRKKKERKHRDRETGDDTHRSGATEEPASARSRTAEDTDRPRKSKHTKKKRHRDVESSDSSETEKGKRSARHSRRRRHRRGSSDSESDSTSSGDSDGSYRRRRRRRRHRHRRSSSDDDDEDDSDHKRRSRRSKKRRDKGGGDSDPEEGSRSARKAEKKKSTATLQEVEKGVAQLDVKSEEKSSEAKIIPLSSKTEEPDRGKKEETERSEGSSEGRTTTVSSTRKDDEGRTSSGTSKNSSKSGIGRQIGEKMRSFLGGGSKKQHSSKSSSGILNACPGTVQGEEGWYEHGENERYYFVLVDGKWSLLYGPMTEDEFEVFSNRVLEQNHAIELPPTYLHKSGFYLNRELRVQKEQ